MNGTKVKITRTKFFLLRICMIYFSLISQEISKRIPLRMHANSQDSTKETLLSQDVAVSLLQENKMALKRCELVSKSAYIYNLVSLN